MKSPVRNAPHEAAEADRVRLNSPGVFWYKKGPFAHKAGEMRSGRRRQDGAVACPRLGHFTASLVLSDTESDGRFVRVNPVSLGGVARLHVDTELQGSTCTGPKCSPGCSAASRCAPRSEVHASPGQTPTACLEPCTPGLVVRKDAVRNSLLAKGIAHVQERLNLQ